MSERVTDERQRDETDWTARHARTRAGTEDAPAPRLVRVPDEPDDDWPARHAETKR